MAPFELSLSESLLLGFCVEEYLKSRSSLFEVFERRLRPFVPLLTQTKWVEVDRGGVPDDIEWYSLQKIEPLVESLGHHEIAEEASFVMKLLGEATALAPPVEYHFLPAISTPFDETAFYLGRARSCPKSVFVGNECDVPGRLPGCRDGRVGDGKAVRIFWDTSRRSLIELVVDHAHRMCRASSPELILRWAICAEERWLWDFGAFLDEKWTLRQSPNAIRRRDDDLPWWPFSDGADVWVFGLSDRLDTIVPDGWRHDVISEAILGIARLNGTEEVFDAGRQFARLALACEEFDAVFSCFEPAAHLNFFSIHDVCGWGEALDETHDQILECLDHALKLATVQRCEHAQAILSHRRWKQAALGRPSRFVCREDPDPVGPVPRYDREASDCSFSDEEIAYGLNWSGASGAAWLAFGDVLATLRETDLATAGKDRPLPSLRSYQLRGDSSVDRVRAALQLAERELASEANAGQHPETVVTCVAHGIEALSRRVWSSDFSAGDDARRTLVAILDQKRRFAKIELEQRFATLALSLYTAYRKPAIHDPDKFRCTWAEAHFFVSGMRVLFDISERLIQDTGGD